jgi:hypothetical protein
MAVDDDIPLTGLVLGEASEIERLGGASVGLFVFMARITSRLLSVVSTVLSALVSTLLSTAAIIVLVVRGRDPGSIVLVIDIGGQPLPGRAPVGIAPSCGKRGYD